MNNNETINECNKTTNSEASNPTPEPELVEFTSRACPRCKELLSVRKLGVWGYFCHRCMFWWGRFEPYPKAGAFKGREDNAPKPKRGRGRPRKRK